MASLRKQAKGDSWQLRVTAKKRRIVLSLSDLSEAQANRWKLFVQAIAKRKKPSVSQGFDEVSQLMSSLGLFQEMGDTGLER